MFVFVLCGALVRTRAGAMIIAYERLISIWRFALLKAVVRLLTSELSDGAVPVRFADCIVRMRTWVSALILGHVSIIFWLLWFQALLWIHQLLDTVHVLLVFVDCYVVEQGHELA